MPTGYKALNPTSAGMAGALKKRTKEILPLGDLSEVIIRSEASNDSWNLKNRISSGSFGDVYTAISEWNEEVAIKIEHVTKDNFYKITAVHNVKFSPSLKCFRD